MTTVKKIKSEIELSVKANSQYWYIGVTNDIQFIKTEKAYPKCLRHWETNSIDEAKEIESFYMTRGCLNCSLSIAKESFIKDDKVFVYIY